MSDDEKDLKIESLENENNELKNDINLITKKLNLTRRVLDEILFDLDTDRYSKDEIITLVDGEK